MLGFLPVGARPLSSLPNQVAAGGGTNFPVAGTFSGTGSVDLTLNVGKPRSYTAVGTVTLARAALLARAFNYSGIGAASLDFNVGKPRAMTAIGTATLDLGVGKPRSFSGVGSADLLLNVGKAFNYPGIGTATLGIVVTPAGGTNYLVDLEYSATGSVTLAMQVNPGALPKLGDWRILQRDNRIDLEAYQKRYNVTRTPEPSSVPVPPRARSRNPDARREVAQAEADRLALQLGRAQIDAREAARDLEALEQLEYFLVDEQLRLMTEAMTQAELDLKALRLQMIEDTRKAAELAIAIVKRALQRARNNQAIIQAVIHLYF